MSTYNVAEYYTLPSLGKIYDKSVNAQVHLRSMTTAEEMRRLSPSEYLYKPMCDIIDACIVEPIGISTYDMCVGDYQYLLHRLRVVTYGTEYVMESICPICGRSQSVKIDLDKIPVNSYTEDYSNLFEVKLPITGKTVSLTFTTPHIMEDINREVQEFNTRYPDNNLNMSYLFTLKHLIKAVDGAVVDSFTLENFLKNLPMADTNVIQQRIIKIDEGIGINITLPRKCKNPKCGAKYADNFRINSEFFGPKVQ